MKKSNEVRVHHEEKSVGVRVMKKGTWGKSSLWTRCAFTI